MRTLKFIVEGQTIMPDPSCDFSGLFPGKNKSIQAEFSFTPEWATRVKVAAFWSMMGAEFPPQKIEENSTCMIPVEALNKPAFKIQVLGKYRGVITPTNSLTVYQKGGKL